MDLRQLAALSAVAEAGSFSAAARRLHTVQSNVSTHVARLEQELGATLVDRATGGLTAEADVVVDRARRMQHEIESLRADVQSMLHEVSGPVRLGCIGTVSRWLVPRLLELMAERHPKVHVVIVDATTTSLVPQVVSDSLDLSVDALRRARERQVRRDDRSELRVPAGRLSIGQQQHRLP